jgi:hypothetical protein
MNNQLLIPYYSVRRKIVGAPHQSALSPLRYLFRCERKPWIERAALDLDGGRYSCRSHYFSPIMNRGTSRTVREPYLHACAVPWCTVYIL